MKNFDGWNEIKRKVDVDKSKSVKVGEVCWCKFGLNIGREQNGNLTDFQRPVIVIHKFSKELVLIAPLTTKIKRGSWFLDICFMDKPQQVILSQIKPIDTKRISNILGEISRKEVFKILDFYNKLIKSIDD